MDCLLYWFLYFSWSLFMSKDNVINAAGEQIEVCQSSYYAVQYGLVVGVAYFENDTWYFTGSEPIPSKDLKFTMIVFKQLFTQNSLLEQIKG